MTASTKRTRTLLLSLLGVGALLMLATTTLAVITFRQTADTAGRLKASVESASQAVKSTDLTSAATQLDEVIKQSGTLLAMADGPAWGILERAPFVADTAKAAASLARAANEIATAAKPLASAVATSDSTSDRVTALLGLGPELQSLTAITEQQAKSLAEIDPSNVKFGLREPLAEAQQSLPELANALKGLAAASQHLPALLGSDDSKTWLVMLQNPAEIRGSGGLFSAFARVRFTDGQPEIVEAATRKSALDSQYPPYKQIPYKSSTPADTQAVWGRDLGEWASFNLSADFPTTAKLAAAGMAKRGTPVDGVIAIDPYLVEALLAGTGPVEHAGVTIDATNAADFFMKDIYTKFPGFPDVAAKDELAMGLMYATIDAALKRPLDIPALWTALQGASATGHVQAWSSNPETEAWLATTPIGGSLRAKPGQILVAFNNGSGGKLDAYVSTNVGIDFSECATAGVANVSVSLENNAPSDLPDYVDFRLDTPKGDPDPPKGSTNTFVTIYGPEGSTVKGADLDGTPFTPASLSEGGVPLWFVPIELLRGDASTIHLKISTDACN